MEEGGPCLQIILPLTGECKMRVCNPSTGQAGAGKSRVLVNHWNTVRPCPQTRQEEEMQAHTQAKDDKMNLKESNLTCPCKTKILS